MTFAPPLTYDRKNHWLLDATGDLISIMCYSGHAAGLNNPAMEAVHNVGPIPAGRYKIGAPKNPVDHLGPLAFPLEPYPENNMFGRGEFYMHGDNKLANYSASNGCIIAGYAVRIKMLDVVGEDLIVI